ANDGSIKYTQVYKDDADHQLVADHVEIQRIAEAIEARRIELGKTSGFERLYAKVTKLYFGGMARHLADLRRVLRPNAKLAYVVGDQASYLRIMIRTGQLLASIAKPLGYEVVGIDLFRTRLATATREQLIKRIFLAHYSRGITQVTFDREEIPKMANRLGIEIPKNLGDLIYSFRYRVQLPSSITNKAPKGKEWIIRPVGRSKYQFVLVTKWAITPNRTLSRLKVTDATPGMIVKYALSDEQALLAKLRYNRLIDIFTGVRCYSLQSHLRTSVSGIGQVESDELYIGVDRRGAHYVLPVQAKGGKDRLSIVQIEQDFGLCAA